MSNITEKTKKEVLPLDAAMIAAKDWQEYKSLKMAAKNAAKAANDKLKSFNLPTAKDIAIGQTMEGYNVSIAILDGNGKRQGDVLYYRTDTEPKPASTIFTRKINY